jgi:hypothetical protein
VTSRRNCQHEGDYEDRKMDGPDVVHEFLHGRRIYDLAPHRGVHVPVTLHGQGFWRVTPDRRCGLAPGIVFGTQPSPVIGGLFSSTLLTLFLVAGNLRVDLLEQPKCHC